MKIYLETDRMILREITLQDEDIILDLDSDPEVMKYLTNGKPSSIDEVRDYLKRTVTLLKKHNGKLGFWVVYSKESKQFMGWFHFRPSKSDPENVKRIELGYRFLKKFWGFGYATEGSLALVKKGFEELDIEEVFAVTMEKNIGSQKVMKKVGLQFVRKFVSPDFPDSKEFDVEYAIDKKKWLKVELISQS